MHKTIDTPYGPVGIWTPEQTGELESTDVSAYGCRIDYFNEYGQVMVMPVELLNDDLTQVDQRLNSLTDDRVFQKTGMNLLLLMTVNGSDASMLELGKDWRQTVRKGLAPMQDFLLELMSGKGVKNTPAAQRLFTQTRAAYQFALLQSYGEAVTFSETENSTICHRQKSPSEFSIEMVRENLEGADKVRLNGLTKTMLNQVRKEFTKKDGYRVLQRTASNGTFNVEIETR